MACDRSVARTYTARRFDREVNEMAIVLLVRGEVVDPAYLAIVRGE